MRKVEFCVLRGRRFKADCYSHLFECSVNLIYLFETDLRVTKGTLFLFTAGHIDTFEEFF